MRFATLALAMLGLLSVGAAWAQAHDWSAGPAAPAVTTVADHAAVMPVRYGYGWRGYGYAPYWGPRAYWYGGPRWSYGYYPGVYAYPYAYTYPTYPNYGAYYYPNGFSFGYYGPRRSVIVGY